MGTVSGDDEVEFPNLTADEGDCDLAATWIVRYGFDASAAFRWSAVQGVQQGAMQVTSIERRGRVLAGRPEGDSSHDGATQPVDDGGGVHSRAVWRLFERIPDADLRERIFAVRVDIELIPCGARCQRLFEDVDGYSDSTEGVRHRDAGDSGANHCPSRGLGHVSWAWTISRASSQRLAERRRPEGIARWIGLSCGRRNRARDSQGCHHRGAVSRRVFRCRRSHR